MTFAQAAVLMATLPPQYEHVRSDSITRGTTLYRKGIVSKVA